MRRPALSTALPLLTVLVALSACRIIPESPGTAPARPVQAQSVPAQPFVANQPAPPEPQVVDNTPEARPKNPAAADFYTPQSPATPGPYSGPPLAYTRIGEAVYVDGPSVTPLALLEDSRCAEGTQCVWAGRLRLRVRVDLGSGPREIEMTLGQPVQIADGQLDLLDALPHPVAGRKSAPLAYQFGFRFMGGL
jgi:hypothetical protein